MSFARRFMRILIKRWPQLRDAKHRERRHKGTAQIFKSISDRVYLPTPTVTRLRLRFKVLLRL
jgi:hypothetical protein